MIKNPYKVNFISINYSNNVVSNNNNKYDDNNNNYYYYNNYNNKINKNYFNIINQM